MQLDRFTPFPWHRLRRAKAKWGLTIYQTTIAFLLFSYGRPISHDSVALYLKLAARSGSASLAWPMSSNWRINCKSLTRKIYQIMRLAYSIGLLNYSSDPIMSLRKPNLHESSRWWPVPSRKHVTSQWLLHRKDSSMHSPYNKANFTGPNCHIVTSSSSPRVDMSRSALGRLPSMLLFLTLVSAHFTFPNPRVILCPALPIITPK